MSYALRAAIATAVSTVDGVKCYPLKPTARTQAGDAWVKWNGSARIAPGAIETSWQVIVLLPQDDKAGDEWRAAREWALIDALDSVLYVNGMEPGSIDDSPALLINCRE